MTFPLRQSTAGQDLVVGAFVDDTDFKTAETALTIANTDIKLMKDGAASVNKNSGGGTHRINGFYSITLDATDTGTIGQMLVSIDVAGALPVWLECIVIEEAVYDLMYASAATGEVTVAALNSNVITAASIAASALDGKGDWNIGKTGYSLTQTFPTNFADLAITVTTGRVDVDTNNDKTGYSVSALSANTITAASIAAGALDGKGDWNIGKTGYTLTQSFPTNFADMAITLTTGRVDINTNNDKTGYSVSALSANVITAASIAASAMDGKGDWNIGKTGYTLTQAFPSNFADMSITLTTGLIDITQVAADKVWSTTARALTDKAGFTISGTLTTLDSLENASVADILTTQMTEAYAADGVAPTLAQGIFGIQSFLQERSVSGLTQTSKKLDGTTTSMTFTLDSATVPTSITRTT